jgi:hypothetical protein
VLLLTLLFGASVALAWLGAGAVDDAQSLVPRITPRSAAVQYILIAVAAAIVAAIGVRGGWLPASIAGLATVVVASWLAEGLVFTLIGPALADEIRVTNAWSFWLVATGFGLQPLAGLIGGIVARSRARAGITA